jgi:hypothetical protein
MSGVDSPVGRAPSPAAGSPDPAKPGLGAEPRLVGAALLQARLP